MLLGHLGATLRETKHHAAGTSSICTNPDSGGNGPAPRRVHRETRCRRSRPGRHAARPSSSSSAPAHMSGGLTAPATTRLASTSKPVGAQATSTSSDRCRNRITAAPSSRRARSTNATRLPAGACVRQPEPSLGGRTHRIQCCRYSRCCRREPLQPLLFDVNGGQLCLGDHRRLRARIGLDRTHLVAQREVDRTQALGPDRDLQRRIDRGAVGLCRSPAPRGSADRRVVMSAPKGSRRNGTRASSRIVTIVAWLICWYMSMSLPPHRHRRGERSGALTQAACRPPYSRRRPLPVRVMLRICRAATDSAARSCSSFS